MSRAFVYIRGIKLYESLFLRYFNIILMKFRLCQKSSKIIQESLEELSVDFMAIGGWNFSELRVISL